MVSNACDDTDKLQMAYVIVSVDEEKEEWYSMWPRRRQSRLCSGCSTSLRSESYLHCCRRLQWDLYPWCSDRSAVWYTTVWLVISSKTSSSMLLISTFYGIFVFCLVMCTVMPSPVINCQRHPVFELSICPSMCLLSYTNSLWLTTRSWEFHRIFDL